MIPILLFMACGPHGAVPSPAEAALAALDQGEVERALELARATPDAVERDLVLFEVARQSGREVCDEIGAEGLVRTCHAALRRPHLRLPDARGRRDPGTAPARCAGLAPRLCDVLLLRDSAVVSTSAVLCAAIDDPELAGPCFVGLAERDGDPAHCAAIAPGTWREDCFFRMAEQLPLPVEARAALCAEAGAFAGFCRNHLAQQAGRALVDGWVGVTWPEAARALDQGVEALGPSLGVAEGEGEDLARELRTNALYELMMRSDEGPATWLARADGQPDVADLAVMSWARRVQVDASLDAWLELLEVALALPGAPEAPLAPEPVPRGAPLPALGKVPTALDALAGCAPGEGERRALAVLWGTGPAPWSEALLGSALRHPSVVVRAAALEHLDDKIWTWRVGEPPPGWLAPLLASQAEPALRDRAAALSEALGGASRPPLWVIDSDALCGPDRPGAKGAGG